MPPAIVAARQRARIKGKPYEYRVTGVSGTPPLENVQVNALFWAALTEGSRLPVRYVPSDPGISHLAIGQIDEKEMSPGTEGVMGALIGAMGVFFLAAGAWQWARAGKAKPADT